MVENAIGTFPLPLGVAQNFVINGREVLIPMAIEEPSVIAGASFMAQARAKRRRFQSGGGSPLDDRPDADPGLPGSAKGTGRPPCTPGGDPCDGGRGGSRPWSRWAADRAGSEVREIAESPIGPFLVLHIIVDVRDAMGANAVNTSLERLTPLVEEITGGRVLLRILSNLADPALGAGIRPNPSRSTGF